MECLTFKYLTRPKNLAKDKRSNLFVLNISEEEMSLMSGPLS
jgi:hypothetical protein